MYTLPRFQSLPAVFHGMSTVQDGNMSFRWGSQAEVLENRKRFVSQLGIKLDDCVGMSLLHADAIQRVDHTKKGEGMLSRGGIEADALITTEPDVFLFLLIADCLPVMFYCPVRRVVALAHVSRMNTGLLFVQKIVTLLIKQFGCNTGNIFVGIGPGIHKESYVLDAPEKSVQEQWGEYIQPVGGGKVCFDFLGYNRRQLLEVGVLERNIEISPVDTGLSKEFFSHYRARRTGEKEGRFATVFGMKQKL